MYLFQRKHAKLFILVLITIIFTSMITVYQIDSYDNSKQHHIPALDYLFPTKELSPNSIENETFLVHTMEIDVQNDESLKIISTFVLANNDTQPIEYFNLEINKNISSVFCYDPIGSLAFTWMVDPIVGNKINISMGYPLLQNELYVFSVSYEIEKIIYHVDQPEEYFGLDFETKHVRKTDLFRLILNLPMYSVLLEESLPSPVFPTPTSISSEDNFLRITWEVLNLHIDDTNVFLVRYKINSTVPGENNPNLLALYIVLAFIGGIAVSTLAFFLVYKLKFKPVESGLVSSLLSNTEQEVIKAINDDSGISTQRRICDTTGYSKSKVSQILAKLEEKEVLKRERWGRTNKVTITNPSFKTIGQNETLDEQQETSTTK